jgi:protein involved in sex pheromone biosynthesis
MKRNFILLLVAGMTILAACKNKKESVVTSAENVDQENPTQVEKPQTTVTESVVIDRGGEFPQGDAVKILKAGIKGDQLQLTVQYGGGCESHAFTLYSNGMYMKSLPPKVSIQLYHNANGDKCRAFITENIVIDISALKYGDKGPLILLLSDYSESITYAY